MIVEFELLGKIVFSINAPVIWPIPIPGAFIQIAIDNINICECLELSDNAERSYGIVYSVEWLYTFKSGMDPQREPDIIVHLRPWRPVAQGNQYWPWWSYPEEDRKGGPINQKWQPLKLEKPKT